MIYALISFEKDGTTLKTAFTFDALTSFKESWSASVAKTAVEGDFVVSDNISLENPKYSLSGMVSRYSVYNDSLELFWDGDDFVTQNESKVLKDHLFARQTLRSMMLNKSTFVLLESDKVSIDDDITKIYEGMKQGNYTEYENCVIQSLDIDSSAGAGGAFFLSIAVEQLNNIADLVTTELSKEEMTPILQPTVSKKPTDLGSSSTSTTTDNDKTKPSAEAVSAKAADISSMKEATKSNVANKPDFVKRWETMDEIEVKQLRKADAIANSPLDIPSVECQNNVCYLKNEKGTKWWSSD